MKKKAILYIRVSTDEQAEKGYSLADQEERLIRHCERNNFEVVKIYKEDYSAKTLQRPALTELREFAKKNKREIDFLVFVKWDRFSRNIRDSYYLIDEFRELNIETCAIEQPLDLNVPESKIMLAIYVATPEVENDRRSMNVVRGMRRAKKTGRWVATAPLGYKNRRDENNKPIIVPDKNAGFIRKAFEDILSKNLTIEEVRRQLSKNGFYCSRSNFNRLIHNPVYIGKIRIPALKDEPEELVDAIHEPIVDANTFWEVQEILEGRKPKNTTKIKTNNLFPLRGFLQCSKCGNTLTASSSRGRLGGIYSYYHCSNGCSERLQANEVNKDFIKLFKDISGNEGVIDLYAHVLKALYKATEQDRKKMQATIQTRIDDNKRRIHKAMNDMTDGKIDAPDYKEMKSHYEGLNTKLMIQKVKLGDVSNNNLYINGCAEYLKKLDLIYLRSDTPLRRIIVGSIFAEKLVYEKTGFRTPQLREEVKYMTLKSNELDEINTGLNQKNLDQSRWVAPAGIEPASSESESEILSIEIRSHKSNWRVGQLTVWQAPAELRRLPVCRHLRDLFPKGGK